MSQRFEVSNEPCFKHKERYCYQCAKPGSETSAQASSALNGSSIEDSLVGRPTVSTTVPTTPAPTLVKTTATPAATSTQMPPLKTMSDTPVNELVRATEAFAASVEVMNMALNLVKELEKRLAFAREETDDAVRTRDAALEKVRSLVGEQS
jgi:hypothetical protein